MSILLTALAGLVLFIVVVAAAWILGMRAKWPPVLDAQRRGEFDITEFDREDMVIVGTPDECLRKLARYDEIGVDQVLCYIN
ncbi:MAG TPA: hypothetical protein PKA98_12980, partial [Acidimicrobiales bacterium]|nr:hypothetical protein [Acidimicrobiales bacterium]